MARNTIRSQSLAWPLTVTAAILSASMPAASGPNPAGSSTHRVFVVDPAKSAQTSSVFAVDPLTGSIVYRLAAGYQPHAVVSPDGSRLYVASAIWEPNARDWVATLDTYDAETGVRVATAPSPGHPFTTQSRYRSLMKVSRSGSYIYMLKIDAERPYDDVYLSVFDTASNAFSNSRASLLGCFDAAIVPGLEDFHVKVVCGHQAVVRDFWLRQDGTFAERTVNLPRAGGASKSHHTGVVIPAAASNGVTVVSANWVATRLSDDQSAVTNAVPIQKRPDRFLQNQVATSHGSLSFFGTGPASWLAEGRASMNEIVRINRDTGVVSGTSPLDIPFFDLALSADGTQLYALSSERSSVVVIDPKSLKELRRIDLPAVFPAFLLTRP